MLIPKDTYPAQTDDTDAAYPHGKARNATSPNDGTGFPLERQWLNDWLGFQQAAVEAAGITPSGNPDTADASDLLDALDGLYYRKAAVDTAIAAAGAPCVAQYTPSASSLALNGTLTLTEAFNFGGFALAGNGVQVPTVGVYRLTGHLLIQSSSTSNPATGLIHTRVGTVGDAGAAEAGRLVGRRYSATTTDEFVVSGSFIYEITDPENELIWLRNVVAASITTPSSGSLVDSFIIERIGRVVP